MLFSSTDSSTLRRKTKILFNKINRFVTKNNQSNMKMTKGDKTD